MSLSILCDITSHRPRITFSSVVIGFFLLSHHSWSYKSKYNYSDIPGVSPVTYSIPVLPVVPLEIRLRTSAWCTNPLYHTRLGTFIWSIFCQYLLFSSPISHSAAWFWLDRSASECVTFKFNWLAWAWKSMFLPVNSNARSVLSRSGIPKSYKNLRKVSLDSFLLATW